MGQRSVPAPFLMKTYEMVDDAATDDVISWGEKGTTFVVWKTAEFAKDLLPNYFKHNNFSSFIRQLNTYGFRKIAPDKWEFANDNFQRGQKGLLAEIRRRKAPSPATPVGKSTGASGGNPSQSISGEEAGSASTSSPGIVEIADLSGENEKLRRDNEILSSELARTKKQCDELMAILTVHLKVGPDQINHILRQGIGACGFHVDGVGGDVVDDDDDDDDDDEKEGLKLFGVWLAGKKRRYCEFQGDNNPNLGLSGPHNARKVMKAR